MQKTLESILKNVPDFTYTVTIDEEKNTLTDFHANLTEPIRKAGLIYLKRSDMTREDKDSYRKVLENSTVELSLKGRDFNESRMCRSPLRSWPVRAISRPARPMKTPRLPARRQTSSKIAYRLFAGVHLGVEKAWPDP